jgi:hypothetical protein
VPKPRILERLIEVTINGNAITMSGPRFIQIHTLASYPAVLLNRDDAGLAKRLPNGGASRIRVSSQCLKRHWRTVDDKWALREIGAPMAVRSREVVEREIVPKLAGAAPEVIEVVRVALAKKSCLATRMSRSRTAKRCCLVARKSTTSHCWRKRRYRRVE